MGVQNQYALSFFLLRYLARVAWAHCDECGLIVLRFFTEFFFPRGNIYLVFLIDWMTQMNLSVVFFVVVLLHGVYFLGMCSYIRTMVDDCKTDLSGLDVSFRDRASVGLSGQYALVEGVRFHSKIIE